jgi:hypothetical protein
MSCNCNCTTPSCSSQNGIDGKNIWTVTTAQFTQPNVGNTVTISVSSTLQLSNQGFGIGQVLFIENGGYYEVTAVPSLTTITVENLGYTGNAAPAATVASGSKVSPGGLVGPAGASGSNGTNGTTLLYNNHTSVSTSGLGPDPLHAYTIAAGELANNGDMLRVSSLVTTAAGIGLTKAITIDIATNTVIGVVIPGNVALQTQTEILITRKSQTELSVTVKSSTNSLDLGVSGAFSTNQGPVAGIQQAYEIVSGLNLNTTPYVIQVYGNVLNGADSLTSQYLTVEKLVI